MPNDKYFLHGSKLILRTICIWVAIFGFAFLKAHDQTAIDDESIPQRGLTSTPEIIGIWEPDLEATAMLNPTIDREAKEFVNWRSIEHLRVFFFKHKDPNRINFQYWSKEFRISYSGEIKFAMDSDDKQLGKFEKVKTFFSESFEGLDSAEFSVYEDSNRKLLRIDTFFGMRLVLHKVPAKDFEKAGSNVPNIEWRIDREFTLTKWDVAGVIVEDDSVLSSEISLQIDGDVISLNSAMDPTESLKIHKISEKESRIVLYCFDRSETTVVAVVTIFDEPFRSELWIERRDELPLYFTAQQKRL